MALASAQCYKTFWAYLMYVSVGKFLVKILKKYTSNSLNYKEKSFFTLKITAAIYEFSQYAYVCSLLAFQV